MSFHTISIFEKPGSQIEAELWAIPGWFKMSRCFTAEATGHSEFVENLYNKLSADGSYVEYHLIFHSEDTYRAWHEKWKDIYVPLRKECLEIARSNGITAQLYWPGEDLGGHEVTISVENFVSKLV